jgi:integrase
VSDGIRPWKTQRSLPEEEVTEWEIDSRSELGSEGLPLPRRRIKIHAESRIKAAAVRRAWLVTLEVPRTWPNPGPKKRPEPPKPPPQKAGEKATLRHFVEGPYLEHSNEVLEAQTVAVRILNLRNWVLPLLGHLTLEQCNTPGTHKRLREHLDKSKKKDGKALGVPYKNNILLGLSAVLTLAADPEQQDDGIPLIPNRVKVKLFKDKRATPGSIQYDSDGFKAGFARHKAYSDEEVRALLMACRTPWERVLVCLGLFLGCRISEAAARLWKDVDWVKNRVHIWSTVCNTRVAIKQPKNDVAHWVSMGANLRDALRELEAQRGKSPYILGGQVGSGGRWRREFRKRGALGWHFQQICKRAGVSRKNYHALRHTFCTRCADLGFAPNEIQRMARHRSLAVTYGYIQVNEAKLDTAGDRLAIDLSLPDAAE